MKHAWKIVLAIKESASYCYTGAMCVLLVLLLCGKRTEISVSMLLSVLLMAAAVGVLQTMAFTGLVVRKLSYAWRMLLFAVPLFAVLAALAQGFGWFPTQYRGAWLLFGGIFLLILLLFTAGFECYFFAAGRRYDGLLGQYRRRKEQEGRAAEPKQK